MKTPKDNVNSVKTQERKTALITGSAKRIGRAIAEKLHQEGFDIAIHYHHSQSDAEALKKSFNAIRNESAEIFKADLSKISDLKKLIQDVSSFRSILSLLVNNASLFIKTPIGADFSIDTWETLFKVNVTAPRLLSLLSKPLMANGGSIINITDIHGDIPLKDYAVYSETKAALIQQTRTLAKELAPFIRVNAISPGAIMWPEGENILPNAIQKEIIQKTPLKRHGSPEFIADAVFMLFQNPFITGQILNVDGGRSLR